MKPRILHLIDSFDEGGSERQALAQIRVLHNSGKYKVFLASLKPDGVLRAEAEQMNLPDIPSFPLKSFYDLNAVTQLRQFSRHLREAKIDLLHTHDFYTNIFGMAAGSWAGVNVRIASRRETSGMRSRTQTRTQQVAYALADRIVANSESVRQKLIDEGVKSDRIAVIYNGLDLKRVSVEETFSREETLRDLGIVPSSDVPKRFVTIVANMRHEVKDYPMFLRAAERVRKAVPEVGFLLAGEGQLQESIKALARQLGIGDKTFLLGRCTNIAQLLSVSDVCVLSSKAEGFSNSILEYMASGRPVVATDVGGAKEAIVEGETGYTVPSGDDVQMAKRIVELLYNREKAQRMGEKGRCVVEKKFSTEALFKNTDSLYDELLTTKKPRRSAETKFVQTRCEV